MGWYEAVKDAASLAQKADNVGLMKQLLDALKEMMDMQQENFELKKNIEELKAIIEKSKHIKYSNERGAIYVVADDGSEEGPYCTHCWELDKATISLHRRSVSHYECPHCKAGVKSYLVIDEVNSEE